MMLLKQARVNNFKMSTQKKVIDLISWIANIPVSRICPTTNLKEDLNLDSIDLMVLIVKLERWFNITLSDEEVEGIETVKDATDCINRYISVAA